MTKDNIFKETNSISTQENKIKSILFFGFKRSTLSEKIKRLQK